MKIVIVGPTGVGKTKLSIELSKYFDAKIINADAVQIYKGLDIGSAKVSVDEMEDIPHYLLDIKNPDEDYSVADYQRDVRNIFKENPQDNFVLVGGTGLYVCGALMDYRFYEDKEIDNLANITTEELYQMVLSKDKDTKIDKNNRVRLERALKRENKEIVEPKLLYDDCIFIGLTTNRDYLYEVINKRVDKMFNDGLVEEVKKLYKKYPNSKILKRAIGYKEVIQYLDGFITLEETKELIKKNSRHYAKRQYTWFNNKMNINWFNVNYDNFNETVSLVKEFIEKSNN